MKISSLYRIYIDSLEIKTGNIISLSKDQSHYIMRVLRLREGNYIRIFNENIGEYLASVAISSKNSCDLLPLELLRKPEVSTRLYLIQSIIKNDKMIQLIDMVTQIGATDIIPIISDRTQNKTINYERYRRCIIESTEQSERITPPILHEIKTIENFYHNLDIDKIFYANEMEDNSNLMDRSYLENTKNIAFIIGPEGGFTDREILSLSKIENARSVSLGSNVLRSETAAITMAAQIQVLRHQIIN